MSGHTEYDFEVCPAIGDTITIEDLRGEMLTVEVVHRDISVYNLRDNGQRVTLTVTHD